MWKATRFACNQPLLSGPQKLIFQGLKITQPAASRPPGPAQRGAAARSGGRAATRRAAGRAGGRRSWNWHHRICYLSAACDWAAKECIKEILVAIKKKLRIGERPATNLATFRQISRQGRPDLNSQTGRGPRGASCPCGTSRRTRARNAGSSRRGRPRASAPRHLGQHSNYMYLVTKKVLRS